MAKDNRARTAAAAVFVTAIIAGFAAPALAAGCPKANALPRITLQTGSGTIVFNTTLGRAELARLQAKADTSSRKSGWQAIGLTRTELQFRMKISVSTLAQRPGRHCATIGRVDAWLGYDAITVYVDRRYRKGSCQHRSVIEHENGHVAVFRDTLALYAPRVEERLHIAAAALAPVSASTAEKGADRLQRQLKREMDPLFNEMNRALDAANARLDTAANYTREQARCSTW